MYVISLKKAIDRRSKLITKLKRMRANYSFVDAIDGSELNVLDQTYSFILDHEVINYEARPSLKPITPLEIACTISHVKAIRSAYLEQQSGVWILEDDADFLCEDLSLISKFLDLAPKNASYIQFQLLPSKTIARLFSRFQDGKTFFEEKLKSPSVSFADSRLNNFQCHGTTAYFITRVGMDNIVSNVLSDGRLRFPCRPDQLYLNRNLLADRYIYWAASDDLHPGYALRIPLIASTASDSFLHEGHVAGQSHARLTAVQIYNKLFDNGIYELLPATSN